MNTANIIIFSLSTTLPLILIITWVLTLTKGRWNLKIFSATIAFIMIILDLFLMNSLLGRPKQQDSADNFVILSYQIREPQTNATGAIWLWGRYDDDIEPLNISIPYNKELHKQLEENNGLKNRRPQILELDQRKIEDKVEYKLKDLSIKLPPKD